MIADKIPIDTLANILKQAESEAALNFSLALQQAGKELTKEDTEFIDKCAMITHLYVFSVIKHLDICEATLKPENEKNQ